MAPESERYTVMTPRSTTYSQPVANDLFLENLENSIETFLLPPSNLHAASLTSIKQHLDPIALSTSEIQLQEQEASRRKRKRGESIDLSVRKPLQLREVYLEGFTVEQVWEQARRILDATSSSIERSLESISSIIQKPGSSKLDAKKRNRDGKAVHFRTLEQEEDVSNASEAHMDDIHDNVSLDLINDSLEGTPEHSTYEDPLDEAEIDSEEIVESADEEAELNGEPGETFIPDKLGLNDGFFSIDDFNRQADFLERQDTRGEQDGGASDEEDVDWGIDPLTGNISERGQDHDRNEDMQNEESEDEESGPTFGNADLNGHDVSESDDMSGLGAQEDHLSSMNNTNDIRYADFFAPPPRRADKPNRRRALPKTQPPPSASHPKIDTDNDIQRTISAVRRDIFEDDLTPDEDQIDDDGATKSSHQKRQAALTAGIRRLEAAAVAKRDWTLSGEARAADRPINSLLEEDLDFERTGKPVPVITQEVSEDIEALIKRRILAREFDEVIRRRPDNLATGGENARRGRIELDDTKPQQSLAEVYEAEQLKNTNPEGYVDRRDEKLKREHAKIEEMWKDVCAKLDALSSWHYRPKPPSASINVVADVPTISMEDARPAAGGEVAGESMLAPQEIYKAGEARDKKADVITGSGLPVGREELSRDEKTRRRRREKERIRKAGGLPVSKGGKPMGEKAKEKQAIIGNLKKGQVRVIGKKGDIKDVEGHPLKARGNAGMASATKFKL